MREASARKMRAQAAWNVITHMPRARPPSRPPTRSTISRAARFVNVIARISFGRTPWSRTRCAMRWVRTRVLPEPAPATISTAPSTASTAPRCSGLRASRRLSGIGLRVATGVAPAGRRTGRPDRRRREPRRCAEALPHPDLDGARAQRPDRGAEDVEVAVPELQARREAPVRTDPEGADALPAAVGVRLDHHAARGGG